MKKRTVIRIAVLFLLPAAAILWIAGCSANPVRRAVEDVAHHPDMRHATVSFLAVDANTGKTIAALNPDILTVRASAQKLFATAAALELLGPDYRPETRLHAAGPVENGILRGDLVIEGRGDVTPGSRHFTAGADRDAFLREWADAVAKAGITSITGRVIADGSAFVYRGAPDGWTWFDLGNYYGAGPAGLCLYDNEFELLFAADAAPGTPARLLSTVPAVPELDLHSTIVAADIRVTNTAFYGAPYSYIRTAVGSIPAGSTGAAARASLPDPEWRLAVEFTRVLNEYGIRADGGPASVRRDRLTPATPFAMESIHLHRGPTIAELVRVTNRESVNLFAEQLVSLIGMEKGGEGSTERGLDVITAYLQTQMDTDGLYLADGCGMSRLNAISARHFCDLLRLMRNGANRDAFLGSLAVAGQSGTLRSICRGEAGEGRIRAKTGTMTRTKSFAGYVSARSGREIAFAYTIVNFKGPASHAARKMTQVLNAMAEM